MTITPLQRTILCLIVLMSISVGIAWLGYGGPTLERPIPDMLKYLALHDGTALDEVPAPFRYRIWTPWIAAQLPTPGDGWFDAGRDLEAQRAYFQFALWNALGLFLASVGLARLCSHFVPGRWVGAGSGVLFLCSYYPLTVATQPMVEAWSYAFLVWALAFLVERRLILLALSFTLGLTCKETILLVIPAALLLRVPVGDRARHAMALLPGLLAYVVWRTVVLPADAALYSAASTQAWLHDLFVTGERLWSNAARALFSLHLLWIPAILGFRRRRRDDWVPARWALIVPGILLTPLLLALVPGRVWFFAFPFVFPLALDEMRRWVVPTR